MIRSNPLLDICHNVIHQYSGGDGEIESLIVKVSGCLWATGSDPDSIRQILGLIARSGEHGGRRAVSGLVKGWSNAIRALIAMESFDTSLVGYCKQARNCRFTLRSLGATEDEVDEIISRYDKRCGIPPIILLPAYWRVLLPKPSMEVFQRVGPLANLGRACPIADRDKCISSEQSFFVTTGRIPDYDFDLCAVGREYGRLCKFASSRSRIPLNNHADFDFTREDGGKMAHFMETMVDRYLFQTIEQLVTETPASHLYDIFGNLVLRREDYKVGIPITEVIYPEIGGGDGLDGRLGLLGLDAAIRDLDAQFPGTVKSDSPYLTFGSFPPNLSFDGLLPSRVSTLAEEGYKARVITIVKLAVAVIGGVARNFLDTPMRTDKLVKVGLLSKVKLYDFLVELNLRERRGVDSFESPSVFYRTALSADLTTSTDTPPLRNVRSLLRGFIESVATERHKRFLLFALEVGCSPRDFVSRLRPQDHVHRCGIMMGEGLSGTYLNVMSGVVRCILRDFMREFDFYRGSTVAEAVEFCTQVTLLIQDFFDNVKIDAFDDRSTQSGDDVLIFGHEDPHELRRFLILLYVALGEVPSESTFYSSEFYATFTEEMSIRHSATLGWVFIDCIKPRLYSHRTDQGISTVLSHISQITGTIQYISDQGYIERVCDVVDTIISLNPAIHDRIQRYGIVPTLPASLGGLDHPARFLEGSEYDIPLRDRELVMQLLSCSLEELWSVKYSWVTDDLPDNEDARYIREVLIRVFRLFLQLPEGNEDDDEFIDLHTYSEECLVVREHFPSYNTYREELDSLKRECALRNLDEIAEIVSRGLRFRLLADGASVPELNPLIRLRNRRDSLISRTDGLSGDGHSFDWSSVRQLQWRLRSSFQGKVVKFGAFLDLLDLQDLPSLLVPIPPFDG